MDAEQREFYFRLINNVMLGLGLLAIGSLILEYGFSISPRLLHSLHYFDYGVLAFFALHDFLKLALARDKHAFIRSNWLHFLFFGLLLVILLFYNPWWQIPVLSQHIETVPVRQIAKFYIVLTQFYILAFTFISALRFGRRFAFARIRPVTILLGSFALVILIGAGLLQLPKATTAEHASFVDALFTSTSATCVTGLIVVDTGTYFTQLGQWIIMILMQLGGLGIMTMAAFFIVMSGSRMSIRERLVMRDLLADDSLEKIAGTLWQILAITLFFEAIGFIAMYNLFPESAVQEGGRIFTSLFHTVSAFCNAGFSTFSTSLMGFTDQFLLVGTFAGLIILGGLGFPVLVNLLGHRFRNRYGPFGRKQVRVRIQTEIVLRVSAVLILSGMVWIYFTEYALQGVWLPDLKVVLHSFFQSVTARTAGFNTVDIGGMMLPALIGIMALMFIGASPASTGGGIKTTSFYLSLRMLWAEITGRQEVEYRYRSIQPDLMRWSILLILASQLVVALSFMLLVIVENQAPFPLLFESISAFGTVGLSMGATPELSTAGKYIIIATMYLGRLGPLAFVIMLSRRRPEKKKYEYPGESVMIG